MCVCVCARVHSHCKWVVSPVVSHTFHEQFISHLERRLFLLIPIIANDNIFILCPQCEINPRM
uniref:Uncharacterized protein n=1 Tax=Octopus bimaculoides TaxID=37653 RepID=A0A0L8I8P9_OCTBM